MSSSTSQRLVHLDALRGFALLGILVMNIQLFAMPAAAYSNPTAYGDLTGANLVVWWLGHLLFDYKFMALFSLLFGSGIGTGIFYGTGLGLYGRVSRVGQLAIVFGVWTLQLWLASWWLKRFRQGVLEWLWRALTYWHRTPFRRPAP